MADTAKKDTQEMRYLLGTLSEDERSRIEDAFFADDAKFAELEVLEDELIDGYVREDLAPNERRQFETKLRESPRLVERVHFARALAERVAKSHTEPHEVTGPAVLGSESIPPPKARWWEGIFARQPAFGLALAACVLLLLVGGAVLLTGWLRLRSESERMNEERAELQRQKADLERQLSAQQAKIDQLAAEVQKQSEQRTKELKLIEERRADQSTERTTPSPGIFATITLTSGQLRGSGANPADLVIRPHNTTALIKLDLEKNDYPRYYATIKYAEGSEFFRRQGLRARITGAGPQLMLSVPLRQLEANRDYLIHVDGVTTSGQLESFKDYQFRVTKKAP